MPGDKEEENNDGQEDEMVGSESAMLRCRACGSRGASMVFVKRHCLFWFILLLYTLFCLCWLVIVFRDHYSTF